MTTITIQYTNGSVVVNHKRCLWLSEIGNIIDSMPSKIEELGDFIDAYWSD